MNKILAIVAFALGFAGVAQAASFQNATGLAAPTSVETFDGTSYAEGTQAANLFAGLSFGSGNYVTASYAGAFPNMVGQVIANFYSSCCDNTTSITFNSAVSGAAFNFISNSQNFTFSAYLGGSLVESATYATSTATGDFVGFTGISFDQITIVGDGSVNDAYLIDNLQIAAVPEPSTYAMLLAGLGMLGFAARRKQQA